jgi:hypothetical protein
MKIIIAGLDKYNLSIHYEENEMLYCGVVPVVPKLFILPVRHTL